METTKVDRKTAARFFLKEDEIDRAMQDWIDGIAPHGGVDNDIFDLAALLARTRCAADADRDRKAADCDRLATENERLRTGLNEAARRAEEIRDHGFALLTDTDATDLDGMLSALAEEAREVAGGDKPHLLHLADDEIVRLRAENDRLQRELRDERRRRVCLMWTAALVSEGEAAEALGLDRVEARGVRIEWAEAHPKLAAEMEAMEAAAVRSEALAAEDATLRRERDGLRAALGWIPLSVREAIRLGDTEKAKAWAQKGTAYTRRVLDEKRAAEARAEALTAALRAAEELLREDGLRSNRDMVARANGIIEIALAKDALAGVPPADLTHMASHPPCTRCGATQTDVGGLCSRCDAIEYGDATPDILAWDAARAVTPPADLTPTEPVCCPVEDPDCEGGDDQSHDACERPDTTQHPAYRAGVEAGIEQSAKACEEVTGAPMWAGHFAKRVRAQLDTKEVRDVEG